MPGPIEPFWRQLYDVIPAEWIACGYSTQCARQAQCTLCASEPSPGFYTGCMIKDGVAKNTGWTCDGHGNLTRVP